VKARAKDGASARAPKDGASAREARRARARGAKGEARATGGRFGPQLRSKDERRTGC